MARHITGRVRLCIDFASPEALVEYVDELRASNPEVYRGVDAFWMDGLDDRNGKGGISSGNTFMLKRGRDRIPGSSLRELIGQERLPRTEFVTGDGPEAEEA